jgi:hypothetical protein
VKHEENPGEKSLRHDSQQPEMEGNMKKPILTGLALLLLTVFTFSQSRQTGAITGNVADEQGSSLPGVNLTLTGEKLMGTRTVVSDVNGLFRFPAVPPGTYSVKAELQGFGTIIQENIRLTTTTTLTLTITLKPTTVAEQVTVIAKSPTVDIKSTETASVTLGSEILRNIPYSQFTSDIVNLAPGVNNDTAYGASNGTGISWQMDGVGVGDPDYGTAWVFLDHNTIEEAKVMGIGLPAEYGNFTGVIFNMITKSGGNQFSGHFEVDFQGSQYHGGSVVSDTEGNESILFNKGDALGAFWSTTNLNPYASDFPLLTPPMEKLLDASAHLGGPIIKDRLWFYAGGQFYHNWDWVTGFPLARDYTQPRGFLKLTSQLSKSTNMSFSGEYDNYNGHNRGASSRVAPDAARNQIDPEVVLNFSLTRILSSKTFFDVKAAYFNGYYNLEPVNGRDISGHFFYNDAPDLPGSGNKRHYNAWAWEEHPRARFQANASLTHYAENFIKGNHDFKFGVEFERSQVRNNYAYTGTNHWYYYDFWGPDAYGYGLYYTGNYIRNQYEGYDTKSRFARLEGFVQDSWQLTSRLNINVGLRFSQNWGWVKDLSGVLFNTNRLAPRLGFTFDLLGDKTTLLKAHYGQFTEGMYASFFDRLNPDWHDLIKQYWDLFSDPNDWVTYRTVRHGTWTVQDGIKHPYMEQFTVGIERELFKDTSFSVTYINRNYRNIIGAVNNLATWDPFTYTVEETGQDFTLYELSSGEANEYVIKNIKEGDVGITARPYRKYWGLEFLFNKRLSNKWQLLASYVYSQSRGTIDNGTADDIGYGNVNYYNYDPNFWFNADGHSSNDPTHMLKIQGTYILPFDINFNVYFRAITGDAWTKYYRTERFAQGNIVFFMEPRGSNHYPMAKTLDLRLEKTFSLATKYKLGVIFDIFNVFNDHTITSWGNRIGYDYSPGDYPTTAGHELYNLAYPRRARIGLRLTF